ncbi:MAG: Sfum_1244 family protein [Cocleimonas sp.]
MNKNIDSDLKELIETVQYNCHIADARHAGDYTLCVYLLKMREMYRWEQGIDFKTQLTTDDVGDWLTAREGLWDGIEEQDYKSLTINGDSFESFDNDLINVLLDKEKLIYNAGLGIRCRPHFFVADLEETVKHDDYTVYISGKEYARDMAAPAAMAQGNNIFIRRESLRRVIWEILDDARVSGLDNPLTRTMSYYNFDENGEEAINEMTEAEIEFVIQHEIGEVQAGKILGEKWNKMMANLASTQAEIMLRAVRDHLADSLTTLPALIEQNNEASIHFYFGNMTAMRKLLAPVLVGAYTNWHETGETEQFKELIDQSGAHWQNLAMRVNELYSKSTDAESIEELIMATKQI